VKRKNKETGLFLVLTLPFNPSDLGGPNRSTQTPASIAIRLKEVRNSSPPHHDEMTARGWEYSWIIQFSGNTMDA